MDGVTIVAMRMLLALALFAGCASTQALETAQRHVQACEYQRDVAAAAGDQQRAARIDADCGAWRTQVAIEQDRVQRSEARRDRFAAARQARRDRELSCTSRTYGDTTRTTCD